MLSFEQLIRRFESARTKDDVSECVRLALRQGYTPKGTIQDKHYIIRKKSTGEWWRSS